MSRKIHRDDTISAGELRNLRVIERPVCQAAMDEDQGKTP
jgi:hypothetical protein